MGMTITLGGECENCCKCLLCDDVSPCVNPLTSSYRFNDVSYRALTATDPACVLDDAPNFPCDGVIEAGFCEDLNGVTFPSVDIIRHEAVSTRGFLGLLRKLIQDGYEFDWTRDGGGNPILTNHCAERGTNPDFGVGVGCGVLVEQVQDHHFIADDGTKILGVSGVWNTLVPDTGIGNCATNARTAFYGYKVLAPPVTCSGLEEEITGCEIPDVDTVQAGDLPWDDHDGSELRFRSNNLDTTNTGFDETQLICVPPTSITIFTEIAV